MKNLQGLQDYLKDNIDVDEVWFNDQYQWCFSLTTVFNNRKSREEVLKMKPEEPEETKKPNAKNN